MFVQVNHGYKTYREEEISKMSSKGPRNILETSLKISKVEKLKINYHIHIITTLFRELKKMQYYCKGSFSNTTREIFFFHRVD